MTLDGSQHSKTNKDSDRRYRIGVLLYFRDESGRLLLINRRRSPNVGLWCAIGGKLEMSEGESPYECAVREAGEEVGVSLEGSDLDLRAVMAEKNYEGTGHWLMFVFEVKKALRELPEEIDEGAFQFFALDGLDGLSMPPLDRRVLQERILNTDAARLHWLKVESDESVEEEELLG